MSEALIVRRGGIVGGFPKFTYTGEYNIIDEGDKNWRIDFLTSGTFTPSTAMTIDSFLVGGGGGGLGAWSYCYGSGGGGGYVKTVKAMVLEAKKAYEIVIGAGGVAKNGYGEGSNVTAGRGGTTSAFGNSAEGGYGANYNGSHHGTGGKGGSGGGAGQGGGNGGSNGSDGVAKSGGAMGQTAGKGSGSTTRPFGEDTYEPLAGGGASGNGSGDWVNYGQGGEVGGGDGGRSSSTSLYHGSAGTPNTGGGGGGAVGNQSGSHGNGGDGGSGIVMIRNAR